MVDRGDALGGCRSGSWARIHFAARAQSDITTRITIRYRAGVTSAMRVLHDGAEYNIREVINPRSGNESLELMCVAEAVAS